MKVIITGATGMVGKAALFECLENDKIDEVLLISRRALGIKHSKIKELLVADFGAIANYKTNLRGYDGCFYCMGVSSIGMSEKDFSHITFDYVAAFVDVLYEINPGMVFNYVSGAGTDTSESGKVMWARIKGKAENKILNKGFKDAYMFRLGAIIPEKGIKSNTFWYHIIYIVLTPFFPLLKKSSNFTTTTKFGKAMINTLLKPKVKKHLENKDINDYSEEG